MKKILLIGLLCANLQAQVYNFESAATGSSGISTATARQNTGWASNGTVARDTLASTYYISSGKRFGVGAATDGQAARALLNVLGRAANDTLLVFSNDGGGVVGDSSTFVNAAGRWSIKGGSLATSSVYLSTGGYMQATSGFLSGGTEGVQQASTGSAYNFSASNNNLHLKPIQQVVIKAGTTVASQAFLTVRSNGIADTTFMVRNDRNSTLDSTFMVFANGDIDAGGNNLYLGGHRIRSNAAGDSLIFYDGSTMIFAILSDGTTADLVATTPFWKFFDKFRNEVLFWILAVAGILACILALLSIYAKVRMLRFGGYETLVENS